MRAACVLLLLAAGLGLAAAQELPPECSHLTDLFMLIGSTDDIYNNCPAQGDGAVCDDKCKDTLKKVRRRRRRQKTTGHVAGTCLLVCPPRA